MHMLAHYAKLMHICIMFFMVVFEILPLKKIQKYFASYILAIKCRHVVIRSCKSGIRRNRLFLYCKN